MTRKRFLVLLCPLLSTLPPLSAQATDVFAAIAMDPPSRPKLSLSVPAPPVLPDLKLESSRSEPGISFPARIVLRTKAEFRAALNELKQQYAPFLEDHTPPATPSRTVVPLDSFEFRVEEPQDVADMGRVWRGEGVWQPVRIPDFRGPSGWWAGYYRKVLAIPASVWARDVVVLRFGAVDYKCQVYLNGGMVAAHEGLFAPFEVDVTPYLRKDAANVLVVRVANEASAGPGFEVPGDKLYAAVGPGWDEPKIGWHHCPPGAGIWQKVYLEGRPKAAVTDIFVRPNLDTESIEVRIEVYQPDKVNLPVDLKLSIHPRNFRGTSVEGIAVKTEAASPGLNEYRARIRLSPFRKWELSAPWLYTLRATIRPQDGGAPDVRDVQFGMREFTMDETSAVKGTLYLNKEPIILRGANTMGHFMRAVMNDDREQLIEDILIGKLANMNYFRLTQSPVQPEVYDYFDRLGMLCQTDLPLFGGLRRTQLEEALKQVGEMERLVRNHPANIMVSYINEPFEGGRCCGPQRALARPELDLFFQAASAVVRVYNPDRVIKPVDGDYQPPAAGIPDSHIYSGWYAGHGVPIGKFIRGYWQAQKDGWKSASGEYGTEGLDDAETMFRFYPKSWLPASPAEAWSPGRIPLAQTEAMHGYWFDTQQTMKDWIDAGQRHQAWATRVMTRAFRRQTGRFTSTAVHLLIDAWPSGWMKSLVDVGRNPKPAFFEYRDALEPVIVDIRTDRTRYYSGEKLKLEFWVCNDRRAGFHEGRLLWEVLRGGKRVFANSAPANIPSFDARFQGYFEYQPAPVKRRERLTVRLGLKDPRGQLIHDTETEVEVFPAPDPARYRGLKAAIVGRQGGRAWTLAEKLGLQPGSVSSDSSIMLVDSVDGYEAVQDGVLRFASAGGAVLFLEQEPGSAWRIESRRVGVRRASPPMEFVSRKTGHPLVASFQPSDFSHWYNREKDYIEYVATSYLQGEGLKPILVRRVDKQDQIVAGELPWGRGSLIFSQVIAASRLDFEPVARAYYEAIIDRASRR